MVVLLCMAPSSLSLLPPPLPSKAIKVMRYAGEKREDVCGEEREKRGCAIRRAVYTNINNYMGKHKGNFVSNFMQEWRDAVQMRFLFVVKKSLLFEKTSFPPPPPMKHSSPPTQKKYVAPPKCSKPMLLYAK